MTNPETKTFEIRDRATFIPALAVRLRASSNHDEPSRYLMRRAGYQTDSTRVMLLHLQTDRVQLDSFAYGAGERTMTVAHQYIENHWEYLLDGQVIDVEYILGETASPKCSEREAAYV